MMKYLLIIATIFFYSCSTTNKVSYTAMYNEKNEKVYKGIITREIIEADTALSWFGKNYKYSATNKPAVQVFANNKSNFKLLVFGGTWCEDTQNLLPLFYKALDESKFSKKRVTLVGVDRKKDSGNGMNEKYKITNVPCFIVLDNEDKEVGRVVEYGKGNGIDVELAEIIGAMSLKK